MVHILFLPGFGIHDTPLYYQTILTHIESMHHVQFIAVDGYTYSGSRYLGAVSMATVLDECLSICSRLTTPYILMGHSSGAVLAGHLYPLLIEKPLEVILINPMTCPPRLRVCRNWIPLPTVLRWIADWLPMPLITTVHDTKIVTMMKYRLWNDIGRACAQSFLVSLPQTATIISSSRDPIGRGLDTNYCKHERVSFPGHDAFRSNACMLHIKACIDRVSPGHQLFENLFLEED